MKQFRATVKASGMIVATIVFAENVNFAIKILQAQFGAGDLGYCSNVPSFSQD